MKTILSNFLAIMLVFCLSNMAFAERFVVVNGYRMSNADIMRLEKWHCGPFPDGSYWLNFNNGIWGYAGDNTPQGNIADNCYQQQRSRPGLSERGLLYSPGELLR